MTGAEVRRRLVTHYASDPVKATMAKYYGDVLEAVLDGLRGMGHPLRIEPEGHDLPSGSGLEMTSAEWQHWFVIPSSIEGAIEVIQGRSPKIPASAVIDTVRPSEEQRVVERGGD